MRITQDQARVFYEKLIDKIREDVPGFEVRYKSERLSSKVLGLIVWLFNKRYMTDFTTTRGGHVYFPSREFVHKNFWRALKILSHEYVHLMDRKRKGVWFSWLYLFPQILVLIPLIAMAVFAFVGVPTLWWAIMGVWTIACLMPAPAYWRMKYEMRGYSMNMFVAWLVSDKPMVDYPHAYVDEDAAKWIAGQFLGKNYFFMWPFRSDVYERISRMLELMVRFQSPAFQSLVRSPNGLDGYAPYSEWLTVQNILEKR